MTQNTETEFQGHLEQINEKLGNLRRDDPARYLEILHELNTQLETVNSKLEKLESVLSTS